MMKRYAREKWAHVGAVEVYGLESGIFIFDFQEASLSHQILDEGPWTLGSRPLILRLWSPEVSLIKKEETALPIWVRLYGLNLHFWGNRSLGCIASVLGKLICIYRQTSMRERLSFARFCVLVSATDGLQDSIPIVLEDAISNADPEAPIPPTGGVTSADGGKGNGRRRNRGKASKVAPPSSTREQLRHPLAMDMEDSPVLEGENNHIPIDAAFVGITEPHQPGLEGENSATIPVMEALDLPKDSGCDVMEIPHPLDSLGEGSNEDASHTRYHANGGGTGSNSASTVKTRDDMARKSNTRGSKVGAKGGKQKTLAPTGGGNRFAILTNPMFTEVNDDTKGLHDGRIREHSPAKGRPLQDSPSPAFK
ncbi:uncharacterized protein LOC122668553 [Telopea speciosissima]|uniref:uncharacterized protein LOC122668553 n=1 Tax=Telopea speciosissima TaxID=54955 RepID=UPI001CC80A74|nr:uncharacterized protein LOC122668553 [Telopea speciosissima]